MFTKIIYNILKVVLPRLFSKNQGGFMHKGKLMDNIILVQEKMHTSKENKNKGMVIKMNMVNAFDRVCHSFVYEVLQRF
jgi:hypothetical protein